MDLVPAHFFAHVDFFLANQTYEQARKYIKALSNYNKQDATFLFFLAVIDSLEGNLQESMREFSELLEHKVFSLPAMSGQLCVYNLQQDLRDRPATERIMTTLNQNKKDMDSDIGFLSAWTFFHHRNFSEAQSILQRVLQKDVEHDKAYILAAQIELNVMGTTEQVREYIEIALKRHGPEAAAARLLQVQTSLVQQDLVKAQQELHEASTLFDKLLPVRVMNVALQMALRNWEGMQTAVEKVLVLDQNFIIPHVYASLYHICAVGQQGAWKLFEAAVQNVMDRLPKSEPRNPKLWAKLAQIFGGLSNNSPAIQGRCLAVMQQAATMFPNSGACLLELGNQFLLQDKIDEAQKVFERAMKFPAFGVDAMIGLANCEVSAGMLNKADAEVEKIMQLLSSETEKPITEFLHIPVGIKVDYLRICLEIKRQNDETKTEPRNNKYGTINLVEKVSAIISKLLERISNKPFNLDYLASCDAHFSSSLVQSTLNFCPSKPHRLASDSPLLTQCEKLLSTIHSCFPGLSVITTLLAKVHFLKSEFGLASNLIETVLESENFGKRAEGLLVAAEIYLHQGQTIKSKALLDRALANNFQLNDDLQYLVLKARTQRGTSQLEDAVTSLLNILEKPGVRQSLPQEPFALQDRCKVYTELSDALVEKNDFAKTHKILAEADRLFRGTSLEPNIIMAQVEMMLALDSRSVGAVPLLQSLGPEMEDHYYRAQERLASYYLKNGQHKEFIEVYQRLFLRMKETPVASIMLGEAYLRIPIPGKALEVIQNAMKRQPENLLLEATMGLFYSKCHMFANGLNYYEAAVKKGNRGLRIDFGKLLIKLNRHERVIQLLQQIVAEETTVFNDGWQRAQAMVLLGNLFSKLDKKEEAKLVLEQAKERIEKLLQRARWEKPDSISELSRELAKVLRSLSDAACKNADYPSAVGYLERVLQLSREDDRLPVFQQLCSVSLLSGDVNEAFRLVKEMQKLDPDNSEALRFSAEVAVRRKDVDQATALYKEYLKKFPDDLLTIAQIVIPTLARAGQINIVKVFEKANADGTGVTEQGITWNACRGVYYRYSGDIASAVKFLTPAMELPEWNFLAGKMLIEMLCNWDTELIGSQNQPSTVQGSADIIRLSSGLLQRMKLSKDIPAHVALQTLPLLLQTDNEKLVYLLQTAEKWQSKTTICPAQGYVLATLLIIMGLKDRAVVVLKQFDKHNWNFQDGEYLERIWLLLAETQNMMISNRNDDVSQLLFKAMEYNKSGYLVNMYEGFSCGTHNYSKASECFRRAFEATGNRDFVSGERFAVSELNASRPMDAIDALDALERGSVALNRTPKDQNSPMWASALKIRQRALQLLAFQPDGGERGLQPAAALARRTSRV